MWERDEGRGSVWKGDYGKGMKGCDCGERDEGKGTVGKGTVGKG